MSDEEDSLEKRHMRLRWQSHRYWDSDPDRAIAMLEEAIQIAEELDRPYWLMESRHWLAQALVFKRRDYTKALPLTVQTAVEARQPMFQSWSTRICLYQDLIAAHVGTDAISYAGEIEAALQKMQAEASPESQCTRCLLGERTSFEIKRRDLEAAHLAAQNYLSKSTETHHRSHAQVNLAYIAFLKREWPATLKHAEAAEKAGKQSQNQDVVIEALLLQAAAHQQSGQAAKAGDCFQQSEAQRILSGVTMDMSYWDVRVAYFEFTGDMAAAMTARQEHVQAIAGHGALREEAEAWLDLCRLQKAQGEIATQVVQQTRSAIEKLRVPGDLPGRLNDMI